MIFRLMSVRGRPAENRNAHAEDHLVPGRLPGASPLDLNATCRATAHRASSWTSPGPSLSYLRA